MNTSSKNRRKLKPETIAHNRERDKRLGADGFVRIPVAARQLRTTEAAVRMWVHHTFVTNQKHDGRVYVSLAGARAHQKSLRGAR